MSDTPREDNIITHLIELRDRLLRSFLAIIIVFLACMPWASDIYSALAKPMLDVLPNGAHMIATDVTSSFFVPMKVTLLLAFVFALPYVLYQIWAFVAPGLYAHEKNLMVPIIVSSFFLFLVGMAFAYFLVFPTVFKFMAGYTPAGVQMATDIDKYLSFVLSTFLAFGLTFEVPVVVVVVVRLGMVSIKKLAEIRPYVVVGAFVIGAVFTPPDVLSQLLLAIPLYLLYETGILVARLVEPKPSATSESTDD